MTATITALLRDGHSLRLRPVRPDDRQRWLAFHQRLSPASHYLRFGYARAGVTQRDAELATCPVAPEQAGWVATSGEGDAEEIIGYGGWAALADGNSVEIALVVGDDAHMRGVGTALLEAMAVTAVEAGYTQMVAFVLAENSLMQELVEHLGFPVTHQYEGSYYRFLVDLTDAARFTNQRVHREHVARAAGVRHLLCPSSVAVIGASRSATTVGGSIFRNLLQGFTGPVFPVNPKAQVIAGVLAYPSVLDVPAPVDLAIIAVPAKHVLDTVEECARKGVWGVVVISAGFGETGPAGKELEWELRQKALAHGMRMVGPNCLGILNNDPAYQLNATFARVAPSMGPVSIGSQSGAVGLALLDFAASIGLGVNQFVSLGNKADISSNDLLEYWAEDPGTRLALLYLESFGNPRRFSRTARRFTRLKPAIVLKSGRTEATAKAVSSHTGALAASDVAADALFRRAGLVRVDSIPELFGAAQVLAYQPLPTGNRVAIVTNAGGPGILAADMCSNCGLVLAQLSDETRARLRASLPASASVNNPVDMLASAPPEHYHQSITTVLTDPGVDAVVCIYIPTLVSRPDEIATAIQTAAVAAHTQPVLSCFMMAQGRPSELSSGDGRRIPSFSFPEEAVLALAHACRYAEYRQLPEGHIPDYPDIDRAGARAWLQPLLPAEGNAWLSPAVALKLLRLYGLPVAQTVVATSVDTAVAAADKAGYPVVMKLCSSTLVHKTDVGGVALNLESADQVRGAYNDMFRRLQEQGHDWEGVIIQPMVTGTQELIIGMTQDPAFGPLVMAGLGGVQVEVLKDVAFALHPLTDLDPERMLHQLKSLPVLTGYRGHAPRDTAAIGDALLRFSTLIEDFPEIQQIEVNPLLVFDEGKGCLAVDARVLVGAAHPAPAPPPAPAGGGSTPRRSAALGLSGGGKRPEDA